MTPVHVRFRTQIIINRDDDKGDILQLVIGYHKYFRGVATMVK
jgi:hypothetical protein